MTVSPETQRSIVSKANLAPSVHNTQPARWRFREGLIEVLADTKRFLSVGDPLGNDAGLSCGAAVEGTILALAQHKIGVGAVHDEWNSTSFSEDGLRRAARIELAGPAQVDPLAEYIDDRFTWRGKFDPVAKEKLELLKNYVEETKFLNMATEREDISWLAELNDTLSLKFFSDKPYRNELVSWMRLSKKDPNWSQDGLNASSMQMTAIEALGAKLVLSDAGFDIARALKMARMLISEGEATLSASGVAFFHAPSELSPIEVGRAFYRCWLELTRIGLVCWPMAILADDPDSNSFCRQKFELPKNHRLVNLFRFGKCSNDALRATTARLSADALILP